jgi:hypothetical protein
MVFSLVPESEDEDCIVTCTAHVDTNPKGKSFMEFPSEGNIIALIIRNLPALKGETVTIMKEEYTVVI